MKSIFKMPVGREKRDRAIKETVERFPGQFRTPQIASDYLFRVVLPPSLRWVYRPVAKSGTSSLLKALFEVEYGTKFTTKIVPDDGDINQSHAIHVMANSRVLGRALEYGYSLPDITSNRKFGARIALVRNPYSRVASAWEYLCLSHAKRSRWFEFDRLRMSAICGFDWDSHPNTVYGLRLFLDYIHAEIASVGADNVDEHWRPQHAIIKPAAFQPTIVGRLEGAQEFLREILQMLECGVTLELPHENRSSEADRKRYETAEIKRLCEIIYRDDFEHFGY